MRVSSSSDLKIEEEKDREVFQTVRVKTMSMTRTERSGHARHAQGRIEFALLFAVAYPFFLIAVVFAKFLPRDLRWAESSEDHGKSILTVARNATYSAIPFAFM